MGLTWSSTWEATGRHVVITGASSGIGAELARNFAREGACLALLARNEHQLNAVAEECRQLGAERVEIYLCDLVDHENIKQATQKMTNDFGGFDVVILNAGRSQGCYFEEINDHEQIDYLMKLNVSGVILPLQKLLPFIYKSSNSRIVAVSSTAGVIPVPYRTIYCASKAAVNAFMGTLRIELKDTYGSSQAPKVQVICVPEVRGTALNSGRMDFGSSLPPVEFRPSGALELEPTCRQMMRAIRGGYREWGLPFKVRVLRPLYSMIPDLLDGLTLKHIKKTHFRKQ